LRGLDRVMWSALGMFALRVATWCHVTNVDNAEINRRLYKRKTNDDRTDYLCRLILNRNKSWFTTLVEQGIELNPPEQLIVDIIPVRDFAIVVTEHFIYQVAPDPMFGYTVDRRCAIV
jgi:hypothetical protein